MVVTFQLALSEKEMMERQTWSYKSKEDRQHNNHWNDKKKPTTTKGQTMINKTLHIELKIMQHKVVILLVTVFL